MFAALPAVLPTRQIFVSYSHHDAHWRGALFDTYLDSTFGDCHVWSDAQLRAGEAWADEINRRLQGCSVAVCLVSEHFLHSSFIAERELPAILQRAQQGTLRLVWLPIGITRSVLETRCPALAALQGAASFDSALAAHPNDCPPDALDRARQLIREQVRAAIDPRGADLARLVSRRYEVQRWLGEGNLAAVYKARDRVLLRDVAIKVLKDVAQRDSFMADVREATRTSEEPNFINIYDAGTEDVAPYCVVQHIPGQTLSEALRASDAQCGLPVQRLRRIFLRLVGAIARAHALGITYGNIKPSNIILSEELEPYILPVGRRHDGDRQRQAVVALLQRLQAAAAAGQPSRLSDQEDLAYLVPDPFNAEFDEVDPVKVDQYMLGVLAWHMATGQLPVTVPEPQTLLRDGLDAFAPLVPLRQYRPLMPKRLCGMVARMAALDATQRYAQLKDVLAEPDLQDDLGLVIARDSYRRCAQQPDFDSLFFTRFYTQFLAGCESARPFFNRLANQPEDWARQHRMLKEAVLLLFAFAQQNDGHAEPNVLSRIAGSHAGMPASLYDPFLSALVCTVCGDEAAGLPPFDPECSRRDSAKALARYWRAALQPGIDYLKRRAAG